MDISKKQYAKMVSRTAPPSPIVKDTVFAFFIGGFICTLGQLLLTAYSMTDLSEDSAKTLVSVTLIFLAAVLTSLGIFDKIAKFAGAGTLVPITGFANAVVSPAIEYKADERDIIGLSRKAP